MIRAAWLTRVSYRLRTLLQLGGLVAIVVPVYFIADTLQPVMEESIAGEGGQYFGFLVLGLLSTYFLTTAVQSLPASVGSGISLGTLEALLATPARLPSILGGLIGEGLLWTCVRALVLLVAAAALGAPIHFAKLLPALFILALTTLAYLPFGLIAAALILSFRTSLLVPQAVLFVSALLGGVYYPTTVIPSWIEYVSVVTPLTYGLRALRQVLLDGLSLAAVGPDVLVLGAMAAVLLAISGLCFRTAFRYARRAGTLAQY